MQIGETYIGNISSPLFMAYSDIADCRGDIIFLYQTYSFLINNAYIYLYDVTQNKVSIASKEDIDIDNTKALIRSKYGVLSELILIKQ